MSARAWTAFAAVSALWGIPYLFIKVAVDDGVPPAALAWARVVLGAVVLVALAWRAGTLPALRGRGRAIVLFALVEIAIPFPLIAAGEQRVASSLAAIVIATVPLLIALLALRFDPGERVRGRRLAGLSWGSAASSPRGHRRRRPPGRAPGRAALLVAALGYACGPLVLKRGLADLDPRAAMGASLAVAAVLAHAGRAADPPTEAPSGTALLAILVLGLACTAAAFVLMATLVAEVGPSRARRDLRRLRSWPSRSASRCSASAPAPGPSPACCSSWRARGFDRRRLPPGLTRALARPRAARSRLPRRGRRRGPAPRDASGPAGGPAPAEPAAAGHDEEPHGPGHRP